MKSPKVLLATLLLAPAVSAAQPLQPAYDPATPAVHTHEGFYFRLLTGLGYSFIKSDESDLTIRGAAGGAALAFGGSLAPGFILFGEFFGDTIVGPTVEFDGSSGELSDDVSVSAFGAGAGLTYYLPSNLYLSGTLAASQLSVKYDFLGDEVTEESDWGFGASATIGQEWWVSDNWGLGIAGRINFATITAGDDSDARFNAANASLLFSATYN